ncbi:polysaccharide biosynthesis protein [Actinomycetota bacterium]
MPPNDLHAGSVALVTGGTGSFGQAMARHLLACGASEVRVLSRNVGAQREFAEAVADDRLVCRVGDIRDPLAVAEAMAGADLALHTAAMKLIPDCEADPAAAAEVNVTGSNVVLRAAHDAGVTRLAMVSTDKAVEPTSTMGMTKALMERAAYAYARANPDGVTVSVTRYGNVLYSQGSVVPLFMRQVREGRALTLTDPGMTRFMMPIAQSVRLLDEALTTSHTGDLLVAQASSASIGTLATAVTRLLGVPDHPITVLGPRPGEKQHESLLSADERARATEEEGRFRVALDAENTGAQARPFTSADAPLDVDGLVDLLLTIPELSADLGLA